ncbi:Crp/Fnr family transcriptional regulator [Aestuariivirga sp.]|uniref:Crp/Fnr family transcriptional regulator n=1 Tax=Aestuariivirga sp. TaxID=2650926 RepID=UPI00391B64AC
MTGSDLRAFELFRDLDDATRQDIAASCSARELGNGELVIAYNDPDFDVHFLLSGTLQVNLYSADGQRVGYQELTAGVMFGEISALDGLPRSASVEAHGRCRVARMPRSRFLGLMEKNPRFAMAVCRQLAAHVRRLTTRVFEFSTMAVRQRLRAELLRLAERGASGPDSALIDPLPTHAELASRISTHREAVSREMAWLEANGFTAKRGRSLSIPSLAKLSALLEEGWEQ